MSEIKKKRNIFMYYKFRLHRLFINYIVFILILDVFESSLSSIFTETVIESTEKNVRNSIDLFSSLSIILDGYTEIE